MNKVVFSGYASRRIIRVVAASILAMAAVGCTGRGYQKVGGMVIDEPTERHPILMSKMTERISFKVRRGDYGLSNRKQARLSAFGRKYRQYGTSKLMISAPTGTSNETAAFNVLNDVRAVLVAQGIGASEVEFKPYSPGNKRHAPVTVSYKRYSVRPPKCGNWNRNLANSPQNLPAPNLGCAAQVNLAAMVANPQDLVEPRGETPRSSERRSDAWRKYVKGKDIVSKDSRKQRAKISDLGNN